MYESIPCAVKFTTVGEGKGRKSKVIEGKGGEGRGGEGEEREGSKRRAREAKEGEGRGKKEIRKRTRGN